MRGEEGQATVELVLFLPFLLLTAVALPALFAWRAADEQAGSAAEAGAMAVLQGTDPRAAVRDALPDDTRATIAVHGRTVAVTVHPRVVVGAGLLSATETADASEAP
jgi:hypothetical protein